MLYTVQHNQETLNFNAHVNISLTPNSLQSDHRYISLPNYRQYMYECIDNENRISVYDQRGEELWSWKLMNKNEYEQVRNAIF